jgi:hypothetical protein
LPATIVLSAAVLACGFASVDEAPEPLLRPGDRVAFVGGSLWEGERRGGELETALTLAVPDVTFRHLGWAGDMADQSARRFFGTAADGREHLLEHVDLVDPTVIFVAYGRAESLPGGMSVEAFEENLNSLLDELAERTERVVLIPPGEARAAEYAAAVRDVAAQRELRTVAADHLVPVTPRPRGAAALRELIRAKNALFFQRHRPQNETYLRGFRAHEQGNNAVEIKRFEPLTAAKDAEIQALREQLMQSVKKDESE